MIRVTAFVGDDTFTSAPLEGDVETAAKDLLKTMDVAFPLDSGTWLVLPREVFTRALFMVRTADHADEVKP